MGLYDALLAPIAGLAAIPMRMARRKPLGEMPLTRAVLNKMGVFPLRAHYYEPLFDMTSLKRLDEPRRLPGIDFQEEEQLRLLTSFDNVSGLADIAQAKTDDLDFHFGNANFGPGDAEVWYHMIRHFRPSKIIEIGSGHSTRMARRAVAHNQQDNPSYQCEHICIEPYEMDWLEKIGIQVIRQKLEDVDPGIFASLADGDILFIDSSHMIRPQGEVLLEFLQILPTLAEGVVVHVHDIFTPRDYPASWLKEPRFWNEQYLLEAFLSDNSKWRVLLANNMMKHEHFDAMKRACPYIDRSTEPGSFYMQRGGNRG